MNPDEFVEVFVSTLILMIGGVVIIYILSPSVGEYLIGILPDAVTLLVYLFIPVFLAVLVYNMLESK